MLGCDCCVALRGQVEQIELTPNTPHFVDACMVVLEPAEGLLTYARVQALEAFLELGVHTW